MTLFISWQINLKCSNPAFPTSTSVQQKVCWMFVQSKNTPANDWLVRTTPTLLQPFARHWGKWSSRPLICWSLSRAQMTRLLSDSMFWHGAQQDDAVKTRGSLGFRLVVWHHVRSLRSPGKVNRCPVEVCGVRPVFWSKKICRTPPHTPRKSTSDQFQKEISPSNHQCSGNMLFFGGVTQVVDTYSWKFEYTKNFPRYWTNTTYYSYYIRNPNTYSKSDLNSIIEDIFTWILSISFRDGPHPSQESASNMGGSTSLTHLFFIGKNGEKGGPLKNGAPKNKQPYIYIYTLDSGIYWVSPLLKGSFSLWYLLICSKDML